ncbi:MAG TPA: hypothetical protein VJ419_01580, partial [Gaiellaceae bacterium]|nr:hypothetical protein [Gaiellaceae bacterium]
RDGLRDLRALPWCSIDNDDSRDLDQLTVAEEDLGLLDFVDTPGEALTRLRATLGSESATTAPSFAPSRTCESPDEVCR